MAQKLGSNHPELLDALIPKNFGVGCRRPTVLACPEILTVPGLTLHQPGNGFLEALSQDNVKVFTKQMQKVTPRGFVDSEGNEHEVDVIICATGYVVRECQTDLCVEERAGTDMAISRFNTSWIPRYPVEANGHSIAKMWAKEPSSYISLGVPHSEWLTMRN